jgi:Lhr-like helicase
LLRQRYPLPPFNEMQTAFIEKPSCQNNLMLLAPTGSGNMLTFLIQLITNWVGVETPTAGKISVVSLVPRKLTLLIKTESADH